MEALAFGASGRLMIDFAPFRQRVRLLRGLKGLSLGLVAGGVFGGAVVALADWRVVDWCMAVPALAVGVGVLAVAGAVGAALGWFRPAGDTDLAKSLDLRAHASDRIATATLVTEGELADALARDAATTVARIQPRMAFPFRAGPWHYSALACCALPLVAHFTASIPAIVDPNGAKEKAEVKSKAGEVERVAREVESQAKAGQLPQEKALAESLRKLSQDMKAERVDRKAQTQKGNEIKKLANDVARAKADKAQQSLTEARELQRKATEQKNAAATQRQITDQQRQVAAMSDQERDEATRKVEAQMEANNRQIEALETERQLPTLSPKERAAIEKRIEERAKKAEELASLLNDLKMDPEVLRKLAEAIDDPANAELKQLAEQLQQKLSEQQQKAAMNQLTEADLEKLKEQVKAMEKQMEALAKQLKDPAQAKQMLEAMRQAMKESQQMADAAGKALQLAAQLTGESGESGEGRGGQSPDDVMTKDTGKVNKSEKPQAEVGKTETKSVTGRRQDQGEESYMEVRGPAELTPRSGVPTLSIPASSTRKAEQSISRGRIPAKHTERVKKYFGSLNQGK